MINNDNACIGNSSSSSSSSSNSISKPKQRAVVVGAGPGGLLTAIHLLSRGNSDQYHVTLIDPGPDYSQVPKLSAHRSWMIGLANHGIAALRGVSGLWENYVQKVGVPIDSFSIFLGKKEIKNLANDDSIPKHLIRNENGLEAFLVDRNYVVASQSQYLNDTFGSNSNDSNNNDSNNNHNYRPMYHHRALYVDDRQRRILVRNEVSGEERYLSYDVLIGAEGVRSVVRNAIQVNQRDFECRVDDIFQKFKAVHIQLPSKLGPTSMALLPNVMPNLMGIALPEKDGNMLCLTIGFAKNKPCDKELLDSDDPKTVAAYVKKHFAAMELVDYDDFALQWCNQGWNTTGQVHASFYHSNKLQALILGDAAHATSPSIGMGMNTALADASALNRILDEHGDNNWDVVRQVFSQERVKEGQSLTDLAYYLFPMNTTQQLRYLLEGTIRTFIWKRFPNWCHPDPQVLIGMGYKLSEVYQVAKSIGIIDKVHQTNDTATRGYWEKQWGMVKEEKNTASFGWITMFFFVVIVTVLFVHAILVSSSSHTVAFTPAAVRAFVTNCVQLVSSGMS